MTADLSPRGRAVNLDRMAAETFDVVIVGGGIVGAGIARDATSRGLRTVLVERGDFASGTSGKTSRLVHGGLRYLKNFKVGLVRSAVRERDLLVRKAPRLVRPLAFTIPTYAGAGTGPAALRFGLFLYDFLSRDKVLPRRDWLSPDAVRVREPQLSADGLRGGGRYHDALTNDARLVLAIIRSAAAAGAVIANYVEATEVVREGGRVAGVRVRDRLDGTRTFVLGAPFVVNAIGVWLASPYALDVPTLAMRPTKGVHVLVPRERVGNREAVVLSAKLDGRMVFVLPWGDLSLIGTTDTDYRGDLDEPLPEADDVAYLLESVNEVFPDARLTPEDVVSAYASLRPLVGGAAAARESDISREHDILESEDSLLSVVGGKLTTQRAMAEQVVDRVCKSLGRDAPCRTRDAPLGPPEDAEAAFRGLGFDAGTAAHLGSRHDPDAFRTQLDTPESRERILPDLPYIWAEVDHAVEAEMAMTLADVMVRRLGIFYEAADQGLAAAPAVAARIAPCLAWDAPRVRCEVGAYERMIKDHRRFVMGRDG